MKVADMQGRGLQSLYVFKVLHSERFCQFHKTASGETASITWYDSLNCHPDDNWIVVLVISNTSKAFLRCGCDFTAVQ